jgi:Uncharacterized protein conserved in bacteria (DUF2330)
VHRLLGPGLVFALALGALLTATLPFAARAKACGGFFSSSSLGAARRPSLANEQVLILYDSKNQREHFIREVVFRHATETFGFVVPTPTRPEVAKVSQSPFPALRGNFNFGLEPGKARAAGFGSGKGRLGGGSGGGVSVLDVKKVGSFTAFVLSASNEQGLAEWLRKQKLVSSPEADLWLAHYVKMGFFYVAMRYDPEPLPEDGAKTSDAPTMAETLRITFSTPIPYYPYFEPKRPDAQGELRLLDLWFASTEAFQPVALLDRDGLRRWVKPMRAGDAFLSARTELVDSLGAELSRLLPAGGVNVQTFQDQKASRAGFGDVLFAPVKPQQTPVPSQRSASLLGVLDPELVPVKP